MLGNSVIQVFNNDIIDIRSGSQNNQKLYIVDFFMFFAIIVSRPSGFYQICGYSWL